MTDRIDKLGLMLGGMGADIKNMSKTLSRVEDKVDANTVKIADLDKKIYGQAMENKHLIGLMHMDRKTRGYIVIGGGGGLASLFILVPAIIKFIISFFGGK